MSFALPIEAAHQVADTDATAETLLADREDLARTMAAMVALPLGLRDAIVLRTIEGLSQAETAAVLGISEKAVETRLYRARAKLEEKLRR